MKKNDSRHNAPEGLKAKKKISMAVTMWAQGLLPHFFSLIITMGENTWKGKVWVEYNYFKISKWHIKEVEVNNTQVKSLSILETVILGNKQNEKLNKGLVIESRPF